MRQSIRWGWVVIGLALCVCSSAVGARPVHHPHKAPQHSRIHHQHAKVVHAQRWCLAHPARCAKQRVVHRTWCAKHPAACTARRAQRRAWCATHPVECAAKRASDGAWDLDLEDAGE